jgi:hypothetical protein
VKRAFDGRAYLLEPNYYRLAYQLSAQQLHLSLLPSKAKRSPVEDRWAYEALESAHRVVREGKDVLKSFERRERLIDKWWPLYRRRLDAPERRLQRFLAETVVPCARMVAAIVLAQRSEFDDAERHAHVVRSLREKGRLSYRALYNLACYEVAVAEAGSSPSRNRPPRESDEAFSAALSALGEALRRVVPRARLELVHWAEKDPGLMALRKHPRHSEAFTRLLARYKTSKSTSESSAKRKPPRRLARRPKTDEK